MRAPLSRWLTLALLGSAVALSAASFGARALACETMRMTEAERPACCDFGSKDRFTRDGGDCCKALWSTAAEPAAERALDRLPERPEVDSAAPDHAEPAAFASLITPAAVPPLLWEHAATPADLQRPRAPFDAVATTVLRN